MPKKRKAANQASPEPVSSDEKIARLLGLFLIKDMEQKTDQVITLRSAGFTVAEVATMLGLSENHVMVATHRGRKKLSRKKA